MTVSDLNKPTSVMVAALQRLREHTAPFPDRPHGKGAHYLHDAKPIGLVASFKGGSVQGQARSQPLRLRFFSSPFNPKRCA